MTSLPIWFEVMWMTINCGFGAAIARSRNAPVYGTILGGVLVGLGGGMTRDVLLGLEPVAISTWYYLPCGVVGAVVGAFLFHTVISWPTPVLMLHGITLGFLVGIGVQKSIEYNAPWLSAMALGVVTASFGGLVADVMTAQRATIAKQAHWVASALSVGAVVYWCLAQLATTLAPSGDLLLTIWMPALITVAVITTLRVVSVRRDWPSPVWPGEPSTAT